MWLCVLTVKCCRKSNTCVAYEMNDNCVVHDYTHLKLLSKNLVEMIFANIYIHSIRLNKCWI